MLKPKLTIQNPQKGQITIFRDLDGAIYYKTE